MFSNTQNTTVRKPERGRRAPYPSLRSIALCLFCCVLLVATTPVSGFVATTITINGDMGDWNDPLADASNVLTDPIGDDVNDTVPPTYTRDIQRVAVTYDNTNLYLMFHRAAPNPAGASMYVAYVDVDADAYMEPTDRVLIYKFTGNSATGAECWTFLPPNKTTSELLTGDNFKMAGATDTLVSNNFGNPAHAPDSSNIYCEAMVPWSVLGLSGPAAVKIKCGAGNSVKNLGDNTGIIYALKRGVTLTPDTDVAAASGTTVAVEHTLTNTGNISETYTLSTTTQTAPAWTTTFSTTTTGAAITSIMVPANSSATIYMRATVPSGTAAGTRRTITSQASCSTSSTIRARATDDIYVGALLVMPDHQGYMAPGETIVYQTSVRNNASVAETVTLTTGGDRGWPAHVYNGATEITQAVLGANTTLNLTLRVSVPSTAAIGTQERTTLRATLASSPAVYSQSLNFTTAKPPLEVTPDRTTYGGDGTYVFFRHTVRNSWPTSRNVSLTGSTASAWPGVLTFADDGVTPTNTVLVAANGGTVDFYVRVPIPLGTLVGHTETVTAGVATGAHSDTAQDLIHVTRLATYTTAGFTEQSSQFALGATVYGRAMGVTPGTQVLFRWRDPAGAEVASSTQLADAGGTAWSSHVPSGLGAVGLWTFESEIGGVITQTQFSVSYNVAITDHWATDIPTVGGISEIGATLGNLGTAELPASRIDYLVWWDSDSNGSFGAGDLYVTTSSVTATYTGGAVPYTSRGDVPAIAASGTYADSWLLCNSAFTRGGTWQVTMDWSTVGGQALDSATDSFYSAMSSLSIEVSAGTIGFGRVQPEDTATIPILVTIHSTKTFDLTSSYVNGPALGLSTSLGPQLNVLPGDHTYTDNISLTIPWGPAGLTTSQVVYTVVGE